MDEFAGRHNVGDKDAIDQMTDLVCGLAGKRLTYRDLITPTGLSAVAGYADPDGEGGVASQ